jgi:RimJ/RimL family protein N-acetyltransferase
MRRMRPGYSMPEITAETARLIFRTEAPGDLDRWMEVMNTPAVMRHLGGVCERHEVEARFAQKAAAISRHGFGFWHLQSKEDGQFIGHCGLAHINTPAAGPILHLAIQIGWMLAESHWGRGYAYEAAVEGLDIAFTRCGIKLLYSQTSEANRASWKLMEKLGMRRAPELDYVDPDYPPEENPTKIYSLSYDQWKHR